jgi:hypothetical protein
VGGPPKIGVSQVLGRLNYVSSLSHLRRISTPIEKTAGKLIAPRKLHNTQWGYICPNETPEGHSVGVVKNLASTACITQFSNVGVVLDMIHDMFQSEKTFSTLQHDEFKRALAGNQQYIIETNEKMLDVFESLKSLIIQQSSNRQDVKVSPMPNNDPIEPNPASTNVSRPIPTMYNEAAAIEPPLVQSVYTEYERKHCQHSHAKFVQIHLDEIIRIVKSAPLQPLVSGEKALDSLLRLELTLRQILRALAAAGLQSKSSVMPCPRYTLICMKSMLLSKMSSVMALKAPLPLKYIVRVIRPSSIGSKIMDSQ